MVPNTQAYKLSFLLRDEAQSKEVFCILVVNLFIILMSNLLLHSKILEQCN
jgi:hypothetical protein